MIMEIEHQESGPTKITPNQGQSSRERSPHQRRHTILQLLVIVCVFVVGLGLGTVLGGLRDNSQWSYAEAKMLLGGKDDVNFKQFWDVWDTVQKEHVKQPVDQNKMYYGAISGLVAGLDDPYSVYFPPEQAKEFMREIEGKFDGIGAEVGIKNDSLVIITPLSGSPAEKAGLRPGDRILAIDGVNADAFTLTTAVDAIRGEKGTSVKLIIQRGEEKPTEIEITRDTIRVESLTSETIERDGKRYLVVTIAQFNDDTVKLLQPVLSQAALNPPDGVVLDLRGNPGGYLDSAVDVASAFVGPDAPVVYERRSDGTETPYTGKQQKALHDIPTVVLVNVGSASAAEIVAGALQDYKRASVIGTTTFGKGTVQDVKRFDDDSLLKFTIAEWLTPDKEAIDKKGIVPDFYVDRSQEDFESDKDPQKDAALLFFTDHGKFIDTIKAPTEDQKKSTIER
jgi:carboxyl-terminal processing protease